VETDEEDDDDEILLANEYPPPKGTEDNSNPPQHFPSSSKFASILGFSLFDPPGSPTEPSDPTPLNMGTLSLTASQDEAEANR